MRLPQRAHRVGVEVAASPGPLREQKVMRDLAEIRPEPPGQGDREALLRPVNQRGRQGALQIALDEILRGRPAELEPGRHAGRELDDLVVEQRRADLERVGHRHPIDLHENIVREVRLQIDVRDPAQVIQAGDPFEVASERREGIVLAQRHAELRAQELSLVHGREQAHVVEVRPLRGQAQVAQEELPAQRAGQSVGLRPGGGQRPEQPVAEPRRQSPAHAVLQHVEAITPGVAAEGLVAAVPGERHGHPLTRGPRQIIGGQG